MFRLLLALLVTTAHAASYQQCTINSTCTIGEFLYNDNYTALPSQSCTLTAKYPDGTAFITNQALTSRSDGWYSYDATIGTTTGLYTATLCCIPSGGTMCLDKSFEVKEPLASPSTLTAADVWSYSSRSLTSFGSLASDVWNSSSRTLTSFGDLVGNIWGSGTRTLTSSESNAALTSLQSDLDAQRLLLEKATQEPLITLELIDQGSKLSTKLSSADTNLNTLNSGYTQLKANLISILSTWDTSSSTTKITTASSLLSQAEALDGTLSFFTQSWDDPSIINLSESTSALVSKLRDLKSSAAKADSSSLPPLLSLHNEVETALGSVSLFLSNLHTRAELLDSTINNIATQTNQWSTLSASRQVQIISSLSSNILKINEYVGAPEILAQANTPQNTILALSAIVHFNQALLANNIDTPLIGMWLEDGSIIYKASLYNPSKLISLDAPLSFYLPRETKNEHILNIDPSLSTYFDPDHDAIKVTGQYTLAPLSTKVVSIELQDIWQINNDELSSILQNTQNLTTSLASTNFYTQGLAMQSSISQQIKTIQANQNPLASPTDRIRAYRENSLELLNTKKNLSELQTLVATTESSRSLKGFLGGAQAASTWGILIVVLTGFTIIGLYLYKTNSPTLQIESPQATREMRPDAKQSGMPWANLGIAAFTILSVLGGVSLIRTKTPPVINQVVISPSPSPTPLASPSHQIIQSPTSRIVPPEGGAVNIRNAPNKSADIIMSLKIKTEVIIFGSQGEWTQIGFNETDQSKGYWVKSEFLSQN